MVTLFGIGNIPGPRIPAQVRDKEHETHKSSAAPLDNLDISPKAYEVASIAELSQKISDPSEAIRAERVAQAKENVQQGAYKVQEVVLKVAARVDRYL